MRPALPKLAAHELLAESRKVMDATAASASALEQHLESPQELVETMRRQLQLVEELIARERRRQQRATRQFLAPIDAAFDLLETSGATLRKQAEALESAGRALEETARLVHAQAALFERAIGALRKPSDRARAAIGLGSSGGNNPRRQRAAAPQPRGLGEA